MNPRVLALSVVAGLLLTSSSVLAQSTPPASVPAAPAAEPAKPAPKVSAKSEKLKVGSKAPALSIAEFVKGEPVKEIEAGKFYVVEFWATWCPPCVESIPHLTKLQKENPSVVFVGISDEDTKKVKPFVTKMGDKMDYRVAVDAKRATSDAYMKASGQQGIPTAFVVNDKQEIAWIGHPMELDEVLAPIVAGKYDAKANEAKKAKIEEVMGRLQTAYEAKDWDKVIAGMDEIGGLDGKMATRMASAKFQVLLMEKKDAKAAYAHAKSAADGTLKDDENALNEIAWTILDAPGVESRDFDLAIKLATRANEVAKGKDAGILDTLARAQWENGDKAGAVATQQKAIAAASSGPAEMKSELEATLKKYQDGAKK